MNNNPLSEDIVRNRFNDAGYEIIEYTYKTNRTRMLCYDKDGYKVKVSLDSLRFNTKEYARFSPTSNSEGFMYNLKLYRSKHPELSEVIKWEYISVGEQRKQRVLLYCRCNECGEIFTIPLTDWKSGKKNRCNACVRLESNLEIKVRKWLDGHNIDYIEQKRFEDCRDKRKLPFDFYLPKYNCCIEVDGTQHFYSGIKLHGHLFDEKEVEEIQRRDKIKSNYCKNNDIELLRLSYLDFKDEEQYKKILSNKFITDRD